MKKLITLFLLSLFLYGCDYKPIYSNLNKTDFFIQDITFKGDKNLNDLINRKLKRYKKENLGKKINIEINSNYSKISVSKDPAGITTSNKLKATVNFYIETTSSTETLNITKNFTMKNLDNKFDEKIYENEITNNLTELIVNELIIYLTKIK